MSTAATVRAAIVVTGDEVLHGRVAESNGAFLARWLEAHGVIPERITVVPDDAAVIRDLVLSHVEDGVDLVITSGGLGGTHDDVTMAAVGEAAGRALHLDAGALATIEARVRSFPLGQRVAPEIRAAANEKQAHVPEGSNVLPPVGTAPGCVVPIGRGSLVVVLPGPPFELQPMWQAATEHDPLLRTMLGRVPDRGRQVLRIAGTIETQMIEALRDLGPSATDGVRMGICAKAGELEVTLADDGRIGAAAELASRLQDAFGTRLYSVDGSRLETVVGRLLVEAGQHLALAESCTGGRIGERLTSVAGASGWFLGGVVSYANSAKRDLLGVDAAILANPGAVSEPAARAMAAGARAAFGADWGLSVTGIAGPSGGTADKPVGTVYLGCVGPGVDAVAHHQLRGDRARIREGAAALALHLLRRALAGEIRGDSVSPE